MSVIRTLLFYLPERYMQAVCEMRLPNVGFLWGLVGWNSTRPLSPFVDGPFPPSCAGITCGLAGFLHVRPAGLRLCLRLATSVGRVGGGQRCQVAGGRWGLRTPSVSVCMS